MRTLLVLLLAFLPAAASLAQTPAAGTAAADSTTAAVADEPQRVVLTDGTVLVGRILLSDDDVVVVRAEDGVETRVPRANIREIGPLLAGGFKRHDPVPSRLFVAPTGRTMAQGTGRISGYYLFPSVAYSPTDRIDLSFGSTIPVGGFTLMNFNAKAQVLRSDRLGLAVGGNAIVPLGSDVSGSGVAGTVYAVLTSGTIVNEFTIGVFGVYASDFEDVEFGSGALVLVGYGRQVSNSVKLISENYVAVGSGAFGLASLAGVRFFGERIAADLAVGFGAGGEGFELVPIPYVGFSYTF